MDLGVMAAESLRFCNLCSIASAGVGTGSFQTTYRFRQLPMFTCGHPAVTLLIYKLIDKYIYICFMYLMLIIPYGLS